MTAPEHVSITVQRHMRDITDLWPELHTALAGGSSGDNAGVHTSPGSRMPINAHVSDVIADITGWVAFLANTLADETDWLPASDNARDILDDIATNRVGHFTEHPDQGIRETTGKEAEALAKLARNTARPTGRRKIRLGTPCLEHDTSPAGERIPCRGEYATILDPGETISDLICTTDPTHRMTPLEWQRAQRHDPARDRDMDALLYGGRITHRSERQPA